MVVQICLGLYFNSHGYVQNRKCDGRIFYETHRITRVLDLYECFYFTEEIIPDEYFD